MDKHKKIGELIYKYAQGDLTNEEKNVLEAWLNENEKNKDILEELMNPENVSEALTAYHPKNKLRIKENLWNAIRPQLKDFRDSSFRKKIIRITSIAAAAVLIVSLTIFFLWKADDKASSNRMVSNDIVAPSQNKATITLANGQKLLLDSALSGTLVLQGDQKLIRQADGKLIYKESEEVKNSEPVFNTLENPKGSKVVDLTLSDGTHIWLNAGSSLTFPVSFPDHERVVTLKGEGYFKVSHNPSKPFIVNTGDAKIQVLGTEFNVNAYQNNANIKVTLLKGSVKLNTKTATRDLKPGQQASIQDGISISNNVNLDEVMAWKNNRFIFNDSGIEEIMKQLENWYNIKVEYIGKPTNEVFMGSISRNVNLSQILALLSETQAVHFEIIGNRVIVKR